MRTPWRQNSHNPARVVDCVGEFVADFKLCELAAVAVERVNLAALANVEMNHGSGFLFVKGAVAQGRDSGQRAYHAMDKATRQRVRDDLFRVWKYLTTCELERMTDGKETTDQKTTGPEAGEPGPGQRP